MSDAERIAGEERLVAAGWKKTADGLWRNTRPFSSDKSKGQVQHCPSDVTRELADALQLENLRP